MTQRKFSYKPAPLSVIRARARQLTYLRDSSKILVALANEFGVDRTLPSRASIETMLHDRSVRMARSVRP